MINARCKTIVSISILGLVAAVYFIWHTPSIYMGYPGIYSTNDGVLYGETRALAEEHQFDMTSFTRFTDGDMAHSGRTSLSE